MLYILNSVLIDNKKCTMALQAPFGLGGALSRQICDLLGFSNNVKLNQLSASQRLRLVECISQNYQTTAQLKSDIKKHKARLISISCYRAIRLTRGLPCRGQRTHGNSRTCRKHNRV